MIKLRQRINNVLPVLFLFAVNAFGEEVTTGTAGAGGPLAVAGSVNFFIWTIIMAAAGLAIAAAVCGMAQSIAIRQGLEGMARQPEAGGQLQTALILGLAFIESLVIYVLLVALILLFANPFTKYFVQ